MKREFDIVAIGEILVDFVPDGFDSEGDSKFVSKAGGAPLNVLATAAKFGHNTAFIGKIGNDVFGKMLVKTLENNRINSQSVVVDSLHNTTLAIVSLDENGDRDFSFFRNFGADVFLNVTDVDCEKIKNSRIFHFGSLSFTNEPLKTATEYAIKVAKNNSCIVSYDPNYRELLWKSKDDAINAMKLNIEYADIVKLSRDEAEMISGCCDLSAASNFIHSKGVRAVTITDGASDVFCSLNGETFSMPSTKVRAIDTTGAGDIFFGSLLSSFLKDNISLDYVTVDLMKKYVKKAIEISGKSVMKKGAIASIPDVL